MLEAVERGARGGGPGDAGVSKTNPVAPPHQTSSAD